MFYGPQAYNWLRKNANLILNLLSLMSDAGIADLSANPVAVLAKVEERFRLDLTDEMVSVMTCPEISMIVSWLFEYRRVDLLFLSTMSLSCCCDVHVLSTQK